ncbi:hypothetical protein SK069_04400 [Patulibacter brassicae]|jgi:hypothetical protein|uniref:Uncharacterized protein n=1 Tax=Patulibacter brassicae TaxID=1705717 RepID=A0ABU4VIS5_9ACTN|nr:hypothetical protein [Patulibacter brassicae]MDX8150826.1 hypothetical protein [Patulibacter brassicae]
MVRTSSAPITRGAESTLVASVLAADALRRRRAARQAAGRAAASDRPLGSPPSPALAD